MTQNGLHNCHKNGHIISILLLRKPYGLFLEDKLEKSYRMPASLWGQPMSLDLVQATPERLTALRSPSIYIKTESNYRLQTYKIRTHLLEKCI
jgi:hypothetical protein